VGCPIGFWVREDDGGGCFMPRDAVEHSRAPR
jgi:hypothetical protein